MDNQHGVQKVRTILLISAVGHGILFVGSGIVRDWIDFLQFMPVLLPHFLMLISIPILGASMLYTKWNRHGAVIIMVSTAILLVYFLMFRFKILPPIIPKRQDVFSRILYEVSYWGTLFFEITLLWFSLKLYRLLVGMSPKNKGE